MENLKQALKSKKVERALLQKKLSKNELKREAGELEKKLKKITNKNNKKILNSSIVVDLSYIKTVLPQTRVLTCADLLQNLTI